eukprot:GEMP01076498.1.p1 GENE.GEMP01076498.1~~GEMP01076498.1.p1  ORF type:complete len:111 (+),score=16.03 GEMP01076498.1:183-515(+)
MAELHLLWLLVIPIVIYIVYRGHRCLRRKRVLDHLNSEYEALRTTRCDVVYHYHWANSDGEKAAAKAHEKHVKEIDGKLAKFRDQYKTVETDEYKWMDIEVKLDDGRYAL